MPTLGFISNILLTLMITVSQVNSISRGFQLDHHLPSSLINQSPKTDLIKNLSNKNPWSNYTLQTGQPMVIPTGPQIPFSEQVQNLTELKSSEPIEERGSCWEDSPFDPPALSAFLENPPNDWRVCKLFSEYNDGTKTVCSGSLVGPHVLLTARHCTYNGCRGSASTVRVSCGYGNGHSYFGSAYAVDHFAYVAYTDTVTCYSDDDEEDIIDPTNNINLDIQLLRLDRPVGLAGTIGYLYLTNGLDVDDLLLPIGYPGCNSDLEVYIPGHCQNQMIHEVHCSSISGSWARFDDAFLWGGESGCPYLDLGDYVACVHHGGCTGVQEICRNIDNNWIGYVQDARGQTSGNGGPDWPVPSDYCQVVEYIDDFTDYYGSVPQGLGLGIFQSSFSIPKGHTINIKVTLLNVGSLSISNLDLRIVASSNMVFTSTDIQLDSDEFVLSGWTLHQYQDIVEINLNPGTYNIGAYWTAPGCYDNDPQQAFIGVLTVTSDGNIISPFGSIIWKWCLHFFITL